MRKKNRRSRGQKRRRQTAKPIQTPRLQCTDTPSPPHADEELPCFQRPQVPSPTKSRSQFGINPNTSLYLGPHPAWALHPDFDGILNGILQADTNGRILLLEDPEGSAGQALVQRLRRSIPGQFDRIQFMPRQSPEDILQLLCLVDVVLDSIYVDAGTASATAECAAHQPEHANRVGSHPFSTLDALAVGAPVVTLAGNTMPARRTYACYRKMDVCDCIAATADEYVQIALRLGTDTNWRIQIRGKILLANHVLYENPDGLREFEDSRQRTLDAGGQTLDSAQPGDQAAEYADAVATIADAMDIAIKHHEAGKLDQAAQLYEKILELDPQHAEVLRLVGVLFHQVGRYDEAVEYLQWAISLRPHEPAFHDSLSSVFLAMGRFDDAAASCEQALQLNRANRD